MDILFDTDYYYQPSRHSKSNEEKVILNYFALCSTMCAEATVSEYFNMQTHAKSRGKMKCRSVLCSIRKKPFEFTACLN